MPPCVSPFGREGRGSGANGTYMPLSIVFGKALTTRLRGSNKVSALSARKGRAPMPSPPPAKLAELSRLRTTRKTGTLMF